MSLSARRAWIEILLNSKDRHLTQSLSARRAWIEIAPCWRACGQGTVALRKESVDRNQVETMQYTIKQCRSPQGERG